MKATVTVELKPSVLDPQGKAIQHSLETLGFDSVEDVRAGKVFRITLEDGTKREDAEKAVEAMCSRLLANTVVEDYKWEIED
ncbi:MAG: phosphoribosylformylglycinamidine synthase subunit PurS [Acidobacteria bacterium]|nr:phosphoribosylformylglycinamidine synthase subunit PurS [Acidobacteriota bacterium]